MIGRVFETERGGGGNASSKIMNCLACPNYELIDNPKCHILLESLTISENYRKCTEREPNNKSYLTRCLCNSNHCQGAIVGKNLK